MFTLRVLEEKREDVKLPFEQVVSNYELGSSYIIIKSGTEEFKRNLIGRYPNLIEDERISSIICSDKGDILFIMKNNEYNEYTHYIMNENGGTFERIDNK
jgi:hypothetical protein